MLLAAEVKWRPVVLAVTYFTSRRTFVSKHFCYILKYDYKGSSKGDRSYALIFRSSY